LVAKFLVLGPIPNALSIVHAESYWVNPLRWISAFTFDPVSSKYHHDGYAWSMPIEHFHQIQTAKAKVFLVLSCKWMNCESSWL